MYEKRPLVAAEIGCNHRGDIETAKQMIRTAADAGADVVKFQKRCVRECLTPEQYNAPHPVPENSYGATYGEHREALEFTAEQHASLFSHCEENGVYYSASVWDMTSAREMVSIDPTMIKIPSACNLRFDMLSYLCTHFSGDIHVSLGMTTREEGLKITRYFLEKDRGKDTVLYACTSGYPVAFDELCLLEVQRMWDEWSGHFKAIGFSGHHLGIAADISAMTLGATVIERHFTLDRTWKGTDHAASLEPDGLRRLCRDVRHVHAALREKDGILPVEEVQRAKLKQEIQAVIS